MLDCWVPLLYRLMPVFPNCEIPISPVSSIAGSVGSAISEGRGFSFVRVGDGEGVALSISEHAWFEDFQYMTTHFGTSGFSVGDLGRFGGELERAIGEADVLGVREDVLNVSVDPTIFDGPQAALTDYVRSHFELRPNERNLNAIGCRRLAHLNRALSRISFNADTTFVSAWAQWELAASGALYDLIEQQSRIGLITTHSSIGPLLRAFFSVEVDEYLIPDKFAITRLSARHFPPRYEELRSEIVVRHPGMLFLVGAGLCGKVYSHWIKERGGVAVDVGSVLDAWIGIGSRPRVLADRFGVGPNNHVPPELLLNPTSIAALCSHTTEPPRMVRRLRGSRGRSHD